MTPIVGCTVCGEPMPMFGGRYAGLIVAASDLTQLSGVSVVAFAGGAYEDGTVASHGVCGIRCAVAMYNEMLQGLMGLRPVAHMAPATGAEGGING